MLRAGQLVLGCGMHALVIGNTDGIGLALTQRLLLDGHSVVGVSRRASSLAQAGYRHVVCDVTAPTYASELRALLATSLPVDVCIYCVGVGDLLNLGDLRGEPLVFRTNLLGLVETTSVILPLLLAAGRGHFIGLSSIADDTISAEAPSYAASKAGVSSYLAGLALALHPRGVHISNVRLGFVDTKMAKSAARPMMMSVERAVDILMLCIDKKPARLTRPRRMALLVRCLRWLALLRLALR